MPLPWDDPRIGQLLVFGRRFASRPHFDVDSVPMVLNLARDMRIFWNWMRIAAAGVVVLVVLETVHTLKTNPGEFDPFETLYGIVPSLAFLAMFRFIVVRVRASFGPTDVTVFERGKTWTQPIDSFLGVSWVHFKTASYGMVFTTGGHTEYRNSSIATVRDHHWIELVHPDSDKTLILAVGTKPAGMLENLQSYSRHLNRPILASGAEVKATYDPLDMPRAI